MARPKDIQEKLMVDAETNVSEDDVIADNSNNVKTPHENGDVRCKFRSILSINYFINIRLKAMLNYFVFVCSCGF